MLLRRERKEEGDKRREKRNGENKILIFIRA